MWSQIISSSSQTPLSPCDNYLPVTIFCPCPEVVIISDILCSDKGTWLSEFGDNQVSHQCVGKGQQRIKPLPPMSFRQNFPSLRLGEMLAQYLNGYRQHHPRHNRCFLFAAVIR